MKISVLGITGKMGQQVAELITTSADLFLVAGTTSPLNKFKDHQLYGIKVSSHSAEAFQVGDIIVDFSSLEMLKTHLDQAIYNQKPLVIGTTGLQSNHYEALNRAAMTIPVLYASNTSLGVAILSKLVRLAAQKLDLNYDIEIHETHHREKIDAPSGTALQLGRAAAAGRKADFENVKSLDCKGRRQTGTIGFSSSRGGGVIGEHTVRFLGDDEVIELSHTGLDRRLYAKGALQAARWLVNQKPGLYTMQDMVANDF